MLTREHARFSISGCSLWLNCPGSVVLNEKAPKQLESTAMKEGSDAHKIVEISLKYYLSGKGTFEEGMDQALSFYDDSYKAYRDHYLKYFTYIENLLEKEPNAIVLVEERVKMGLVDVELFGTADCIILGKETAHVIDFKFGINVAVKNANQMKGYALSLMNSKEEYERVFCHIVQPRLSKGRPTTKMWCFTKKELHNFADKMKKAIVIATRMGTLNYGEWCDNSFCNARHECPAYQGVLSTLLDGEATLAPIKSLTDGQIRELYLKGDKFKKRYESLVKHLKKVLAKSQEREKTLGLKLMTKPYGSSFKDAAYEDPRLRDNKKAWDLKCVTKLVKENIISKEELDKLITPGSTKYIADIGLPIQEVVLDEVAKEVK